MASQLIWSTKKRHIRLSGSENCRWCQELQACANDAGPFSRAFAQGLLFEMVFSLCAAQIVQYRTVQDPRTAETPNTMRGVSLKNTHSSKKACKEGIKTHPKTSGWPFMLLDVDLKQDLQFFL